MMPWAVRSLMSRLVIGVRPRGLARAGNDAGPALRTTRRGCRAGTRSWTPGTDIGGPWGTRRSCPIATTDEFCVCPVESAGAEQRLDEGSRPWVTRSARRGREGAVALHHVHRRFVAGPCHGMNWMTGFSDRPGLLDEYVETTGAVLGAGTDGTRPPPPTARTSRSCRRPSVDSCSSAACSMRSTCPSPPSSSVTGYACSTTRVAGPSACSSPSRRPGRRGQRPIPPRQVGLSTVSAGLTGTPPGAGRSRRGMAIRR